MLRESRKLLLRVAYYLGDHRAMQKDVILQIEEKKYLRDLINLLSNERSNTRDNQNSDANQLMKYYNSSLDEPYGSLSRHEFPI